MAKNEKTSKSVGAIASQALRDPKSVTPKQVQKIAGSVLTQRPDQPPKKPAASKPSGKRK